MERTDAPPRTSLEHSAPDVRVGTARWLALLAVMALLSGLATWLVTPRFDLETPSLVDDWAAIARSPDQLDDVARLSNPEEQRFRPGWIVWNYVQWHTLDAPAGLIGPNLWNLLRIVVLVAGLCLLAALALPRPRGRWEALLYAGLAGIPALLVVTVPKFARDLARFGTQEPLLVGGMALGGAMLVLAGRSLLAEARPASWWRTALLAAVGTGLWLVGVYQKESSVCALPLLAAVAFAGRARLAGWRRLSNRRRTILGALGAVALLPFVHVTIEIARIVTRGDLVYDAEVDGGRGAAKGFKTLYDWADEVFSRNAQLVIVGALVLTALALAYRRRIDVIALGALASGVLSLFFAGQSGVAVSRYYLPAYALFAVALSLSLARLPRIVQAAGLLALVAVFLPADGVRKEVESWVDEEREGAAVVRVVSALESSGCVVAVAGLDIEASAALPVLVSLELRDEPQTCRQEDVYLVVRPYGEGVPLVRACAPGALEPLREGWIAGVYRCSQLRKESVRDPALGLVDPERLVALRRLRPPRS